MDKCPSCKMTLFIANGKFVSEMNSTDVYCEQVQVCSNHRCEMYAGKDLSKPLRTIRTIRNKV